MLGLFKRAATKKQAWPYSSHVQAIMILAAALFLAAVLISHNPTDQSWFYYDTMVAPTTNWCGYVGACIAAACFYFFGGASLILVFFLLFAFHCVLHKKRLAHERVRTTALTIILIGVATLFSLYSIDFLGSMVPGGYCGMLMSDFLHRWLSDIGTSFVIITALCIALMLIMPHSLLQFLQTLFSFKRLRMMRHWYQRSVRAIQWVLGTAAKKIKIVTAKLFGYRLRTHATVLERWEPTHKQPMYEPAIKEPAQETIVHQPHAMREETHGYVLPHIQSAPDEQDHYDQTMTAELEKSAHTLEQKLERFGVFGKIVAIKRGPVVTLFEYQPHIDTKLSKIVALEDDLALALQAMSIRIIAPIPGRSVVGFEIANKQRNSVLLANLLKSDAYVQSSAALPMILGVDTIGNAVVIDLAKMPHLLMAGSTGSGKSVALNAMVVSLLCKVSPDDLRLIIIDPKRLEFVPYADTAHLLFPIVNDPKKAPAVLRWVVKHMQERYAIMAQAGARNIHDYRQLVREKNLESMPFIVVIIDELADLMMCAGKEIEDAIIRISQMARAAGIHVIAATQRPSVDVITGLIKVNFPSRMSFRVTSKIDSRTIIDCAGADKLLGRGDMLFLDANESLLKRVHGAYVLDKEIHEVAEHIRGQRAADYLDLNQICSDEQAAHSYEQDPLYQQVCTFLGEIDEVSISLLQRRFRIGYNRSARIIDMLEAQRLIEPSYGGKTRKVVRQ